MKSPHLFLVASAFLLALGSVLAKYLLSLDSNSIITIDPLPFLTLQLIGGVAFLITVRVVKGWVNEPVALLMRPALTGIILGTGSVGTIMALDLISASEASVVFATQPVLMLGLAWALLGERLRPTITLLCLAAVSGVVIIIIGGSINASPSRVEGLACALMSTTCAALYAVWMRGLSGKVDFLTALIVVQISACVISIAIWGYAAWIDLTPTRVGTPFLAAAAFGTGAIYYGAAFYVYLIGLQSTEASKAGVYLSLVPVFAIVLAWAILSERLGTSQWIGTVIVVAAVTGIATISAREDDRQKELI